MATVLSGFHSASSSYAYARILCSCCNHTLALHARDQSSQSSRASSWYPRVLGVSLTPAPAPDSYSTHSWVSVFTPQRVAFFSLCTNGEKALAWKQLPTCQQTNRPGLPHMNQTECSRLPPCFLT